MDNAAGDEKIMADRWFVATGGPGPVAGRRPSPPRPAAPGVARNAALRLFWALAARLLRGQGGARYKPWIQRNFVHVSAYSGNARCRSRKGPLWV